MKPRILNGALGLAIRPDYSVLLTQRNQPVDPNLHQRWQIPGGGQEYGESLIDTLHREMSEELKLQHIVILDPEPLIGFSLLEDSNSKFHVNLFVYLIDIGNQVPSIADPETLNWKWFSPDAVATLQALPHTFEFVKSAVEKYQRLQSSH